MNHCPECGTVMPRNAAPSAYCSTVCAEVIAGDARAEEHAAMVASFEAECPPTPNMGSTLADVMVYLAEQALAGDAIAQYLRRHR